MNLLNLLQEFGGLPPEVASLTDSQRLMTLLAASDVTHLALLSSRSDELSLVFHLQEDGATRPLLPVGPGINLEFELPYWATLTIRIAEDWSVSITLGRTCLVVDSHILRPVDADDRPVEQSVSIVLGEVKLVVPHTLVPRLELLEIGQASGAADSGDGARSEAGPEPPWWMIAETGLLFQLPKGVELVGNLIDGFSIPGVRARLASWTGFSNDIPELNVYSFVLSSTGVSISGLGLELERPVGSFWRFPIQALKLFIAISNNSILQAAISADIALQPLASRENTLHLDLSFDMEGHWLARVEANRTLETFLGPLRLSSVAIQGSDGGGVIELSGGLKFKEPLANLGEIKVDRLGIRSDGTLSLPDVWVRPSQPLSYDLGPAKAEISAVGFGFENERIWAGFSAGISLDVGIPISGRIDRFRLSADIGGGEPSLEVGGIAVSADLGGAVALAGEMQRLDDLSTVNLNFERATTGFYGSVVAQLIPLKLGLDGKLLFGKDRDNNRLFYAEIGVKLPRAIPLFSTGLGFYGFTGLCAVNLAPRKKEDETWLDWYLARGTGATDIPHKWSPQGDALGIGLGTKIGTLSDDGHTFSGRILLLVSFPGPLIILAGVANILRDRQELETKPPMFNTLAVFDPSLGQLQLGLTGNVRIPDRASTRLLEVGGTVEALFDFDDASRWYLNIGTPEDPLQGKLLQLINGSTYLNLNPRSLSTGATAIFSRGYSGDVFEAQVRASVGGQISSVFDPFQFTGGLDLAGELRVSVFGCGFSLGLAVNLHAQAPTPFEVEGRVKAHIETFWEDIEISSRRWSGCWVEKSPRWTVGR